MKRLILVAALLSGCSFIMPVPYDPAGGAALTDIAVQLDKVSCIDKEKNEWQKLVDDVQESEELIEEELNPIDNEQLFWENVEPSVEEKKEEEYNPYENVKRLSYTKK